MVQPCKSGKRGTEDGDEWVIFSYTGVTQRLGYIRIDIFQGLDNNVTAFEELRRYFWDTVVA